MKNKIYDERGPDEELQIKIYNNDCICEMKRIEDDLIKLIVTDPPYNLANFMKKRNTNLAAMRENFFVNAGWDNQSFEEWEKLIDGFFKESVRILKKGGAMIVFMATTKVESVIKVAERYGLYYKTTGVWHKTNPMPRNMNLHFINSTESWIYFTYKKKTGTFNNNGKALHDFVETLITPKSERKYGKHPTQKPEGLIQHFVKILSDPEDWILDPFMGSGTTGVVAKRLNRNFIGIELNENYFEIANSRIRGGELNKN